MAVLGGLFEQWQLESCNFLSFYNKQGFFPGYLQGFWSIILPAFSNYVHQTPQHVHCKDAVCKQVSRDKSSPALRSSMEIVAQQAMNSASDASAAALPPCREHQQVPRIPRPSLDRVQAVINGLINAASDDVICIELKWPDWLC